MFESVRKYDPSPDIMQNYIKILAYNELIRQIKTSGLTQLNFDVVLSDAKWKGDEWIRQNGFDISVKKEKTVTLKNALCWVRGTGWGETTSETIYKQLIGMQRQRLNVAFENSSDADGALNLR